MSLNSMPVAYRLRHKPTQTLLAAAFDSATAAATFGIKHLAGIPAGDLEPEPGYLPSLEQLMLALDMLRADPLEGGCGCYGCGTLVPAAIVEDHAATCAALHRRIIEGCGVAHVGMSREYQRRALGAYAGD